MTVSLPSQQPAPSKETQAARKRRRRAPAGGAADDCFACIKRGAKCDRRRPYCSQCLEVGNECSGYKTQLTWGVGVASRGKLRGLSLPIAKSPPVAQVNKKPTPRSRANTTSSQWSDHGSNSPTSSHRDEFDIHSAHAASMPTTPFATYHDFTRFTQGESIPPTTPTSWAGIPYSANLGGHEHPKMHRLNTSLGHFPLITEGLSPSVDALSDVDYTLSPLSQFSRDELPYMHSPTLMYDSYSSHGSPVPQSPVSAIMIDRHAPTSCPSLVYAQSEPSSSLGSHHDGFEQQMNHARLLSDADTLSVQEVESYNTNPGAASFWAPSILKEEDNTPHLFDQASAAAAAAAIAAIAPYDTPSVQVSPDLITKMPFFMDYYENIMCPSMVLVDGPTNPFRDHVLRLAANSRSLQHAICALSACNLRMKRKLSLGQHGKGSPERFMSEQSDSQSDDLPLTEEYQHRNLAVHLLNQQLNDPAKSCHDSVLATILLLCHYRMVESGIAKFATQFAGVKKILGMRNSAPYQSSNDSAWMEAIFTYFDAISASINDREAQLNHAFYGVTSDVNLLPAGAENWIGCDRELFKTISKLGRLNLLSQHRSVSSAIASPTARQSVPRVSSPLGSPLGNTFKNSSQLSDFFSLGVQGTRFDGNGFAAQLEEDEFSSGLCSSPSYDDQRSTFWREWKEARNALQSWEFDSARIVASLPGTLTQTQIRDLGSLSEAFRYAALLYTERLASPNVPSSHNNFRNLVSQVVYYATSLESGGIAEKFLLWPLFVAGSECVNELQQNIVRNKCRDIMSRSGYMNNLSAIEVLERLWAGDLRDNASSPNKLGLQTRGPFNWTKCIGGPGVDVEWIMF